LGGNPAHMLDQSRSNTLAPACFGDSQVVDVDIAPPFDLVRLQNHTPQTWAAGDMI
jgi:hypothetical protein